MRSFVHQFLIVKDEERINSFFSATKTKELFYTVHALFRADL